MWRLLCSPSVFLFKPARYGGTGAKVGAGSLAAVPTEGGSQLKVMEAGVNSNAAKFNELKLAAERKTKELGSIQDALDCLRVEVSLFS